MKKSKKQKKYVTKPITHIEIVLHNNGDDGYEVEAYEVDKTDPVQITKDLIYKKWQIFIPKESPEWDDCIRYALPKYGSPELVAMHLKAYSDVCEHLDANGGVELSDEEMKALVKEKCDKAHEDFFR